MNAKISVGARFLLVVSDSGDILVAMKRNWKVPPTSRQECLRYKDFNSPAPAQ